MTFLLTYHRQQQPLSITTVNTQYTIAVDTQYILSSSKQINSQYKNAEVRTQVLLDTNNVHNTLYIRSNKQKGIQTEQL